MVDTPPDYNLAGVRTVGAHYAGINVMMYQAHLTWNEKRGTSGTRDEGHLGQETRDIWNEK